VRILFVTNHYPPYEVGGYEQLCRDMVVALSARGHICEVITSTRGVVVAAPSEPGVHRVLHIQPDFGSRLHPALQFVLTRRSEERGNLEVFHGLCGQLRPEVVFVWNVSGFPRSLLLGAEALPGVTVAYWLAGYSPADPDEWWQYWATRPEQSWLQRWLRLALGPWAHDVMRREGKPERLVMRHVATVSNYDRKKGMEEGSLPNHTEVIYNGVEVDAYQTSREMPDRPLRLLFAGRISEDKGPRVAIHAVDHLVHRQGVRDIHLTIVGAGPAPCVAALKAEVRASNLSDYVTFQGWQPRQRMPAIMAAHEVLLMCTCHQEAFARVVLEAMASGMAVLGTLTGGTGEILEDGVTGLTFPVGDSMALAEQIMRLSNDPQLWLTLSGEGCRVVRERFSMDSMIAEIERYLEQARATDMASMSRV
jgi:glycogen(starch) synthase